MVKNEILQTSDYKIFKTIPGNRLVDKGHVKLLERHMLAHGNLTGNFPVTVNENMEVIDGQHRIKALKNLKWPVYYRIEEGLNIATIRHINSAQQNWTWKDYAGSFADLGNKEYAWLLLMSERFPTLGYSNLLHFCGVRIRNSKALFQEGNFKCEDKITVLRQMEKYAEITELVGYSTKALAEAMLNIMKHPDYDHAEMVRKMEMRGKTLPTFSRVEDYLRAIEEIYNWKNREGFKTRLF